VVGGSSLLRGVRFLIEGGSVTIGDVATESRHVFKAGPEASGGALRFVFGASDGVGFVWFADFEDTALFLVLGAMGVSADSRGMLRVEGVGSELRRSSSTLRVLLEFIDMLLLECCRSLIR
jgi:hypothetical protein